MRSLLFSCTLIFLSLSSFAKDIEITVSAAASLNNAFTEIAKNYEKTHPNVKVLLNFGASGTLLQQMDKGAPVDIFASADQKTMDQAVQKQLINDQTRQNFINNTLVLIAPSGSVGLENVADLNNPAITKIAIGNPDYVPVGRYTQQVLEQYKQWNKLQPKVIFGQNVRQVLDYVARAEVEAGFVYGSDASIMQDKVTVKQVVPASTVISYPIAVTKNSKELAYSQAFITYVLSEKGQAILAKYGFQPMAKQ